MMLSTRRKKPRFLLRRMIRLIPLYWILTIGTFAAAKIYPAIIGYSPTVGELIKSMLCIPYSRTALKASTAIRPIVGLGHTLEFEVVFCILFAAAMLISHKHRGVIALGLLSLLTLSSYLFDFDNVILQFYVSNRWLAFMAGIGCYYLFAYLEKIKLPLKTRAPLLAVSAVTLAAVVLLQVFAGALRQVGGVYYAQLFVGALLIVLAVFYSAYGLPVPRGMVKLGDISFSFYLIHYYIVSVTERFFHLDAFTLKNVLIALAAIVLAWAAAYASWWLIEHKLTDRLNRLLCRDAKSIGAGAS